MTLLLPGARAALTEGGGPPTREHHRWCALVTDAINAGQLTGSEADAAIAAIATALGSPDGTVAGIPEQEAANAIVAGYGALLVRGTMAGGRLDLMLQGDALVPGNTQYYGSDAGGDRGLFPVAAAFTTPGNITLTTGADGVTDVDLATVANTGGGTLLRIVRDAWGRITGTSAATTTDLAEGTNLYHTTARARAAAVADTLTDGVLDVAPSQNAVVDALALRPADNLLINGDFGINQRGFAGGALAAGVYGHDRWKAGAGGCSYTVSGATITHTSGPLVQAVEAPGLASTVIIVSVEDPSGSITVDVDGVSGSITSGSGRRGISLIAPSGSTGNVTLTMTATSVTYRRVKLEVGVSATRWQGRPAAAELALCQRYFEKSFPPGVTPASGLASIHYFCSAFSSTLARTAVPFKVTKRIPPTIVTYASSDAGTGPRWCYYSGSWIETSSTTTPIINEYGLNVDAVGTLTTAASYLFSGNWTADAEL